MNLQNKPLAHWKFSSKEWDNFVSIELRNKKEDNFYFGIGIIILGTAGLMLLRSTGFWMGIVFSLPLAILVPWLRMKFSYRHLKKGVQDPELKIFNDFLLINRHKIELRNVRKEIKSMKVLNTKSGIKLLEFNIRWLTAKGPTNDEIRIPIPENNEKEVEEIISNLR